MKKLIMIFFASLLVLACSNKHETISQEIKNDEIILKLINQAISDYNNNLISEKEKDWNITINPKPINITNIPIVKELSDLIDIEEKNEITSAKYIKKLQLEDYSVVFKIYDLGSDFWLNGECKFYLNEDKLIKDNKNFENLKNDLNLLLKEDLKVLSWLYGLDVKLSEIENKNFPGFFKVVSIGPYNFKSIDEIKEKALTIFTEEFLNPFFNTAFEKEDPVYIEDKTGLYCSGSDSNMFEGLPYNTSLIVSSIDLENEVLVDILLQYGEDISYEIKRIVLTKTLNGLRLNNSY